MCCQTPTTTVRNLIVFPTRANAEHKKTIPSSKSPTPFPILYHLTILASSRPTLHRTAIAEIVSYQHDESAKFLVRHSVDGLNRGLSHRIPFNHTEQHTAPDQPRLFYSMAPLKPHWNQPSHPDAQVSNSRASFVASRACLRVSN
jgi:hypothetical protein